MKKTGRLVTAAFLVAALLCGYFVVTDWLGLNDDEQALFIQTIGLAAFAAVVRRTSPWRRRKLRLRWPLVVTSIGLLLAHLGTVGAFVILYHPGWRGPHWELLTVFELVVFGVVLSWGGRILHPRPATEVPRVSGQENADRKPVMSILTTLREVERQRYVTLRRQKPKRSGV